MAKAVRRQLFAYETTLSICYMHSPTECKTYYRGVYDAEYCPAFAMEQGGDGLFVAVGGGGTLATSPDARAWTDRNVYDSETGDIVAFGTGAYTSVAFGNNKIVTFNSSGRPVVNSTSAATTFTQYQRLPNTAAGTNFNIKVAFGNGYFVAVGRTGLTSPNDIGTWVSTDGISWTFSQQLGATGLTPVSIDYVGGRFYVQMSDGIS